jgi:hypothetical protein
MRDCDAHFTCLRPLISTKRGIAHLCKEEAETEATEDSRPPKKNKATAPRVRPREETNEKISQPEPGTNDPDPEEELQALEAWSEYKPKLPISLLLSEDHSIPNERRSDSRGESASTAARPPVQSEGRADGGRGSSPEFAYRGGDSRLDHMLDANDKQALEQLLEGGDKVFELSDAFGDKPTGMLSASLGGSTGSTLAAMIPWKPTTSAKDNVSSSASSSSDEARGAETIQNPFLREEALTAAALRGITSYNYTWGYAKLAVVSETAFHVLTYLLIKGAAHSGCTITSLASLALVLTAPSARFDPNFFRFRRVSPRSNSWILKRIFKSPSHTTKSTYSNTSLLACSCCVEQERSTAPTRALVGFCNCRSDSSAAGSSSTSSW